MRNKITVVMFAVAMAFSTQASAFDFDAFKRNAAKMAGEAAAVAKDVGQDLLANFRDGQEKVEDAQGQTNQSVNNGEPVFQENYRVPHNQHPRNFDQAKKILYTYVYREGENHKTSYCGCDINYTTQGKWNRVTPDIDSCGLKVRQEGNRYRAERIEAEHIVPASLIGLKNNCILRNSKNPKKRDLCDRTDENFSKPYTDLHNLTPITGEVNADRSNFPFREVTRTDTQGSYGQCEFPMDFRGRVATPPERAKGQVARAYLYMSDRYRIQLSKNDRATYMKWHQENPPTAWELEKNRRVKQIQGNSNPYVQDLD